MESIKKLSEEKESPTARLDRHVNTASASFSFGLSPIALGLALTDWGLHLAAAPGRRLELASLALENSLDLSRKLSCTVANTVEDLVESVAGESEHGYGFNNTVMENGIKQSWQLGMDMAQDWWRQAAQVRGVSSHHQHLNTFLVGQVFSMLEPANWPLSHPEVLRTAIQSGGQSFAQGGQTFLRDVGKKLGFTSQQEVSEYKVAVNIAVTPGTVVFRNHLVELIRYLPQTEKVAHNPVFIVPSWIMKYYILDLSPHNSMVRFLVAQGYTVYILSWANPEESDRELGMNDYLQLGIFDVLKELGRITNKAPVNIVGYCLGGTLLAIAVAALSRSMKVTGFEQMSPVKSMTLLAAQTDFSEPGQMGVLIDDSQVQLIEDLMADTGYLSGAQMAGSFQFLNSRDLVWNKRLNQYLLGVRESGTDMMAWNADVTRLPARMHGEYLNQFFLQNALADGDYLVEGQPVSLLDIRVPVFVVGTVRDTVSPWPSVYKIHRLTRTEVTFLLVSGGHNAGIVSEPGHPNRSYQIHTQPAEESVHSPTDWQASAEKREGSWWPAWDNWLAAYSGPMEAPPPILPGPPAPGEYVFKRYG